MISELSITNFKLFGQETRIPLSNLNLLTGINGKGKSTVLQCFLILSQSTLANRATNKIMLNGVNVKLGNFGDIKNRASTGEELVFFKFTYNDFTVGYSLHSNEITESDLDIVSISAKGKIENNEFEFNLEKDGSFYEIKKVRSIENTPIPVNFKVTLFDLFISGTSLLQYTNQTDSEFVKKYVNLASIHYVSADRIGPKNYYENKSLGDFIHVGALGENTANVLFQKGNDTINDLLLLKYCQYFNVADNEISRTVADHTNLWMNKIFQGAQVDVSPIKGEDLLKLKIRSEGAGPYYKPTNVGYGFSYSLPIIVSGLIAKPGEILIIENPEAHLHPYAQSILAKFLAMVSCTGVQVIIESHSEHFLNGLRIAVKNQLIDVSSLSVIYFGQTEDALFQKIGVDADGGISNWPKNFFDQATKDLNYLFGI